MSLVFLLFHPAHEITLCLKPVSPNRLSTPERAGHASDFGIPSRTAGVPRAPECPLQTRHRNLGLRGGRHCGDDATDRFPGAAGHEGGIEAGWTGRTRNPRADEGTRGDPAAS